MDKQSKIYKVSSIDALNTIQKTWEGTLNTDGVNHAVKIIRSGNYLDVINEDDYRISYKVK